MKPKELAKKIANRLKDINNPEMLDGDVYLEFAEDLIFQEIIEALRAEQSKQASERIQKGSLIGKDDVVGYKATIITEQSDGSTVTAHMLRHCRDDAEDEVTIAKRHFGEMLRDAKITPLVAIGKDDVK